jgi:hypothetical protein
MVSLEYFIDIFLPAALWPWIYSASNRNEQGKGKAIPLQALAGTEVYTRLRLPDFLKTIAT